MEEALLYGFLSGVALLIGSFVGLYLKIPQRNIAQIMAFGSGVLISALSIDLMSEAFEITEKTMLVSFSFLAGALVFVGGDMAVDSIGAEFRKSTLIDPNVVSNGNSGMAILLGTLLDGIPESLVMGATLSVGGTGGLVFVAAVFLSNFPEGISGTIAMKNSGMSSIKIIGIWVIMLLVTILCTVVGYQFLGNAPSEFRAASMAFASGAILAMLSDTMLPESFKEGGKLTGIFVVIGFLVAFLVSKSA
jgi:ZIP family zinc transporter